MTEDTLEDVINDGVMFVKSLTKHYGADKAMEVWEAMNLALGEEVKGRVFFKMIEGSSACEVKFSLGNIKQSGKNLVSSLKLIRRYTGFSLKESKDLVDNSEYAPSIITIRDHRQRVEFIRELRNIGADIS